MKRKAKMLKWIFRLGCALVVLGLLLLSPIGDLLPVGLWESVKSLFSNEPQSGYIRVVPTAPSYVTEFGLIFIGLVMVAIGKLRRSPK